MVENHIEVVDVLLTAGADKEITPDVSLLYSTSFFNDLLSTWSKDIFCVFYKQVCHQYSWVMPDVHMLIHINFSDHRVGFF